MEDKRHSSLQLCGVFFANRGHEAKLHQAAEHARCEIGAARIVANILSELLFAAVWSFEARFNSYLTHEKPLVGRCLNYQPDAGFSKTPFGRFRTFAVT